MADRPPEPTEPEAWALLLTVHGLGPAGFGALLREYGGGRAILEAAARPRAAARFADVAASGDGRAPFGARVGSAIVELSRAVDVPLRLLRAADVAIVTLDDPRYPPRLREIDLPPPVLFVRGDNATLAAVRTVAVVGTRRPSERGRLVAARIGAALARAGAVVVSGLAVGIDGAAHAAVVAEGRPTVAVLGSGHGHLFPRAHARLAGTIVAGGGAVVSEMWPDDEPSPGTFPRRNRLISGLSAATIVVEAGERSGALITATWALEQGRDCFFVPGPIDDPRSAGCLRWLHDYPGAARIVASIPDLIEDLGLFDDDTDRVGIESGGPRSLEAELIELGPTASEVARALIDGHGTLDELVAATDHGASTVLGAITLLELRGLATTTYGRYRAAGRLASAAPGEASAPLAERRPVTRAVRREGANRVVAPRLPHHVDPC